MAVVLLRALLVLALSASLCQTQSKYALYLVFTLQPFLGRQLVCILLLLL